MESGFLKLVEYLLRVSSLKGDIKDYEQVIINKIDEYNKFFKLKKEEVRFRAYNKGVVISPVPFASTGGKIKIAIIGLNPKFDEGSAAEEKIKAGNDWDRYSNFYNSARTLDYVINDKKSTYYANKIKLLQGLRTGKSTNIGKIEKAYGKSRHEIFTELTTKNPILLAEFIPFHSKSFKTGSKEIYIRAYESLPGFAEYVGGLIKIIEETLEQDGLIIIDGQGPADFFRVLYNKELTYVYEKYIQLKSREKVAYGIYNWRSRKVILTGGVIYGQSQELNSDVKVQEMLDNILKYCNITFEA